MKNLFRMLAAVSMLTLQGCETCPAQTTGCAVVFSGFTDQNGNSMNRDVTLTLLNQPIFNGLGLTYSPSKTYHMQNFSLTVSNLAWGNYNLSLQGLNRQLGMAVPNDLSTHNFMDLVTNQLPTYTTTIITLFGTNDFDLAGVGLQAAKDATNAAVIVKQPDLTAASNYLASLIVASTNTPTIVRLVDFLSASNFLQQAIINSTNALASTAWYPLANFLTNNYATLATFKGSINLTSGTTLNYNGSVMDQAITASHDWFGGNAGNLTLSGAFNAGFGEGALAALTSGTGNTAFGDSALAGDTTGKFNTAVGFQSMLFNTIGSFNIALGYQTMFQSTTGSNNIAIGQAALGYLTAGINNVVLGPSAGSTYTSTESSNLLLYSLGVIGDNRIIRIGNPAIHLNTYIAGILNGNGFGFTNLQTTNLIGTTNIIAGTPGVVVPLNTNTILGLNPVSIGVTNLPENQVSNLVSDLTAATALTYTIGANDTNYVLGTSNALITLISHTLTSITNASPPLLWHTATLPLIDGQVCWTNFPHALSHPPFLLRGVLQCTANDDCGMAVGREVELYAVFDAQLLVCPCIVESDATNIFLFYNGTRAESQISLTDPPTTIGSMSSFAIKVYWLEQ